MLSSEEDAFICDLAEYYHIYDYNEHPVRYIATLLTGLREDSRTILKLTGRKVPLGITIEALTYDVLNLIMWSKTKDGHEGINQPRRLVEILHGEEKESDIASFDSGEELLERFREITRE